MDPWNFAAAQSLIVATVLSVVMLTRGVKRNDFFLVVGFASIFALLSVAELEGEQVLFVVPFVALGAAALFLNSDVIKGFAPQMHEGEALLSVGTVLYAFYPIAAKHEQILTGLIAPFALILIIEIFRSRRIPELTRFFITLGTSLSIGIVCLLQLNFLSDLKTLAEETSP